MIVHIVDSESVGLNATIYSPTPRATSIRRISFDPMVAIAASALRDARSFVASAFLKRGALLGLNVVGFAGAFLICAVNRVTKASFADANNSGTRL
jgi:hypothetical protein